MLCQSLSFITGLKSFSKAQLSHSWRGKGKMYIVLSSGFFSPFQMFHGGVNTRCKGKGGGTVYQRG